MSILATFSGLTYTIPEQGDAFTQSLTDLLNALASKASSKVAVPAAATSPGSLGQWAADSSFVYFVVATNQWKRVAIASW